MVGCRLGYLAYSQVNKDDSKIKVKQTLWQVMDKVTSADNQVNKDDSRIKVYKTFWKVVDKVTKHIVKKTKMI